MARYYFDVTNGDGKTVDDAGQELTAISAENEIARIMADIARDCIAAEKRGQITVKARDEFGRVAYAGSLIFAIKKVGND